MTNEILTGILMRLDRIRPDCTQEVMDILHHHRYGNPGLAEKRAGRLIRETTMVCENLMSTGQRIALTEVARELDPEPDIRNELSIHTLLFASGLSQTALSERFKIPLRTVQGWCNGTRKAPPYVLGMMREILFPDDKN